MTKDEMIGWHHQLNGHKFDHTLGNSEGQGSLACCSPWGCKESDMTERQQTSFQDPIWLLCLCLSLQGLPWLCNGKASDVGDARDTGLILGQKHPLK